MSDLNGKVALVTGGSRGMGAAIVKRLAQEGADVGFTYVNSATAAQAIAAGVEKLGRKCLPVCADSVDVKAVVSAVDQVASWFGKIDILVNNAGIFTVKPFEESTYEDFEKTISVNTRATFFASQTAAVHMPENGRIISIGSNLVGRAGMPGLSLYNLSKAALVGFTKSIARDLGPRGITANIIHPGSTDTDMNPADGPFADVQRSAMAIPRYGDPKDIASLVAWLASEESHFVTGAEFTSDGGTNA
ncbi:SDR family NAD(P)-dependent oxidoreductase [Flexibacterium corallicola]|uniref:SDR family NAD(P)-dependent oxidoreductase n=1 Tax=Flexibacterium corallicola TaxID=3037259 RepID=UPI00286F0F54|nr:3-oxoacyl-ACP reductase family protein [Pseudovibrio sp. M1P-2-3]